MCDNPTNPISTNQVIDVGVLKPRCANFCGNTLNDWLQWLAESNCEVDWTQFDLSKITSNVIIEQTQKEVITQIIEAISLIKGDAEKTISVSVNANWSATRGIKVRKKGSLVLLSGLVTGGTVTNAICTLPSDLRPTSDLVVSVANEFAPSALYNVFLKIKTNGDVILFFTGSGYATTSPNVYLDGVSFFLN